MKPSVSFIIVALTGLTLSSLAAKAAGQTDQVLLGLAGMRCDVQGVGFEPCLPNGVHDIHLMNLQYRHATLDLTITGHGTLLKQCTVNGQATKTPFVDAETGGPVSIVMQMGDSE